MGTRCRKCKWRAQYALSGCTQTGMYGCGYILQTGMKRLRDENGYCLQYETRKDDDKDIDFDEEGEFEDGRDY